MCNCVCTDAENIEAESLADGLVDKLIWKAVKAHMTSKRQGSDSFILWIHLHKFTLTTFDLTID